MKIYTHKEGLEWGKANLDCDLNFQSGATPATGLPEFRYNAPYLIPQAAKKIQALASIIIKNCELEGNCFFYIYCYEFTDNQFSSIEIFDGFRLALKEHRSMIGAPFHVFEKSEADNIQCLLALAIMFDWQSLLMTNNSDLLFDFTSGLFYVSTNDEKLFSEFLEIFEWFKLKKV